MKRKISQRRNIKRKNRHPRNSPHNNKKRRETHLGQSHQTSNAISKNHIKSITNNHHKEVDLDLTIITEIQTETITETIGIIETTEIIGIIEIMIEEDGEMEIMIIGTIEIETEMIMEMGIEETEISRTIDLIETRTMEETETEEITIGITITMTTTIIEEDSEEAEEISVITIETDLITEEEEDVEEAGEAEGDLTETTLTTGIILIIMRAKQTEITTTTVLMTIDRVITLKIQIKDPRLMLPINIDTDYTSYLR